MNRSLESKLQRMEDAIEKLKEVIVKIKRHSALIQMTRPDNMYKPLVQLMCRLKLIKGWST